MIPGIVAQAVAGASSGGSDGVVELLLGFNGTNGSTLYRDEGVRSRPVSFFADAQITTAQSKFGGSSLNLDGSGDAVFIAPGEGVNPRAEPFTVDFWMRRTSTSSIRHIIGEAQGQGSTNVAWAFTLLNDNTLEFKASPDGFTFTYLTTPSAIPVNTWTHIALDRDPTGYTRLYVNGVMVDSESSAFDFAIAYLGIGISIGNIANGTSSWTGFQGQLDEIRFVKNQAMYASDSGFTPPTAAYGRPAQLLTPDTDPYFGNVLFLLGGEGERGYVDFKDDSSYHRAISDGGTGSTTPIVVSNVDNGVFQEDAVRFRGAGRMQVPDSNDWAFGTDPFTVEAWVKQSSWTVYQIIAHRGSGTTDVAWSLATIGSGAIEFIGNDGSNTVQFNTPTTGVGLRAWNNWQHLAVDRDATGKYRLYINGICRATSTSTVQNLKNISQPMTVGSDAVGNIQFVGHMDEIRVTRGVARYATDTEFLVPEKRFSRNEDAPGWTVNPALVYTFTAPGDTITCTLGTNNLRKITRQWLKDGNPIAGQTSDSYKLQPGDLGSLITCRVQGRNYNGFATFTPDPITVVSATFATGQILTGTDRLVPDGDMQSGTDALLWRERLT